MMRKISFIGLLLIFALVAGAEIKTATVSGVPLNLRKVKLNKEFNTYVSLTTEQLRLPVSSLYLEIYDLDELSEAAIKINGHGPINLPMDCVGENSVLGGSISISKSWLQVGTNNITFIRKYNARRRDQGLKINKGKLFFANNNKELKLAIDKIKIADPRRQYSRSLSIRYNFADFINEKTGNDHSCWLPFGESKWKVSKKDQQESMLIEAAATSGSLLQVFGQNSIFSGRFKLENTPKTDSVIGILTRYNYYPGYMIIVKYIFSTKKWIAEEHFWGARIRVLAEKAGNISQNQWHSFFIEMNGSRLLFKFDNKTIINCRGIENLNYGKLGVLLTRLSAKFKNLKVRCESIPMYGVTEFEFPAKAPGNYIGSASLLKLKDGNILLQMRGNRYTEYLSHDQGHVWIPQKKPLFSVPYGGIGTERMKNGDLVQLFTRGAGVKSPRDILSRISHDDGKSWTTAKEVSHGGVNIMVNGKITVTKSGRIFAPVTKHGGTKGENKGGVRVYYSDDGENWQKSTYDLDIATTGHNLQEGQVVDLGNRKLMLVMRCKKPYLYAAYSNNNGESWTKPVPLPLPSVLNAFGVKRASDGEIYVFWTYDDTSQHSRIQFPRERVCLASSKDNGKSWQFLGDIDAFGSDPVRFMNLGLYIINNNLFLTATVFKVKPYRQNIMKLWRINRKKLKPYPKFPPLH